MRFRKKPVVIEAVQFDGSNMLEIVNFAHQGLPAQANSIIIPTTDRYFYVRTLEGEMMAVKGDWIVRGIKGEFYPCKPDIFEATYEKKED